MAQSQRMCDDFNRDAPIIKATLLERIARLSDEDLSTMAYETDDEVIRDVADMYPQTGFGRTWRLNATWCEQMRQHCFDLLRERGYKDKRDDPKEMPR